MVAFTNVLLNNFRKMVTENLKPVAKIKFLKSDQNPSKKSNYSEVIGTNKN